MTLTITAEAVAWYGAIVATLVMLLEVVRLVQDRARVVVKGKANWRVINGGQAYPANVDFLIITVVNKGRRPVTIEKVALIPKDKKNTAHIFSDSIKQTELLEGKSASFLGRQSQLPDLKSIKYVVAIDAAGNEYKGKIENITVRTTKKSHS